MSECVRHAYLRVAHLVFGWGIGEGRFLCVYCCNDHFLLDGLSIFVLNNVETTIFKW
jgi:hypothetical protein